MAADIDPVAAAVHVESELIRLGVAAFIVARLAAMGELRPDLTIERAVAATLVLMDPAVHRTLVREHGWTRPEYTNWIERSASAELLGDTSKEGSRAASGQIGRMIVTASSCAEVTRCLGLRARLPGSRTFSGRRFGASHRRLRSRKRIGLRNAQRGIRSCVTPPPLRHRSMFARSWKGIAGRSGPDGTGVRLWCPLAEPFGRRRSWLHVDTVFLVTAPWTTDALVAALRVALGWPGQPSRGCSAVEVQALDDVALVDFNWRRSVHRFAIRVSLGDAAEGMSTGLPNETPEDWAREVAWWLSEELDTGFVGRASRRMVDGRIELSRPSWPSDDRFYLSASRPGDRVWSGALWSIGRDGLDADTPRRMAAETPALVWLRSSLNSPAGGPAVGQAVVSLPAGESARLDFLQVADGAPDSVSLELVRAAVHQAADAGADNVVTDFNGEVLDIVGFRNRNGQTVLDTSFLDADYEKAVALHHRVASQPLPEEWRRAADRMRAHTRVHPSHDSLE